MLNRFLTVLTLTSFALACTSSGDDASPSTEVGVDAASTLSQAEAGADDSPTGMPGGPDGCYFLDGHYCDCEIDEGTCEEDDGTWTDECECDEQDASMPMTSVEAGGGEISSGCYMPNEHTCDCDIDEAACDEVDGIWSAECTSCGRSNVDAGGTSNPSAHDAGQSSPGPGCYSPAAHTCDCDTTQAQCDDDGNIWSEECSCGGESAVDGGTPSLTEGGAPFACYLPGSHACDCSLDEESCADENGVWTDECTSCDSTEVDAGEEHSDPDASTGVFGCYDPTDHSCTCDTTESDCTTAGYIWTDQCTTCGMQMPPSTSTCRSLECEPVAGGDSGVTDSGVADSGDTVE